MMMMMNSRQDVGESNSFRAHAQGERKRNREYIETRMGRTMVVHTHTQRDYIRVLLLTTIVGLLLCVCSQSLLGK